MVTLATTQAPGGAKPPFPPFNPETFASQILWFAITFVLLYLLMSRVALPRVGAILSERSGRISGDLADAQKAKDDTDAAIAGYESKLADARANAQA
ncbi:MAG: F0F1 ATP synthase subunit B', partial [Pseudorhodoplanes sp.]